jgi:ribosomal protein L29
MKEIKDLKLKDLAKINTLKQEELLAELKTAQKELYRQKMKLELNELKQTHLIKFLRRYIARLKTIATAKSFNI